MTPKTVMTAYCAISTIPTIWLWTEPDYGPAYGMLLLGGLSAGAAQLWKAIEQRHRTYVLRDYAQVVEPIFVHQEHPSDRTVFLRAEEHRKQLTESKNEMYQKGLIEVIEVYFRDPYFDYCESFDEYLTRLSDFKRDYLREWAKKTWSKDDLKRKQYLHNQLMPQGA